MKIVPMKTKDINKVLEIERDIYKTPFTVEAYLYELNENPFAFYFLAKEKEEIIGYIGCWITFETAQITKVSIARKYQGQKLSHILLDDLEKRIKLSKCSNITLEVRVSNLIAQNLYKRHGFKIVALRKNYYENNEDAFLMEKVL